MFDADQRTGVHTGPVRLPSAGPLLRKSLHRNPDKCVKCEPAPLAPTQIKHPFCYVTLALFSSFLQEMSPCGNKGALCRLRASHRLMPGWLEGLTHEKQEKKVIVAGVPGGGALADWPVGERTEAPFAPGGTESCQVVPSRPRLLQSDEGERGDEGRW